MTTTPEVPMPEPDYTVFWHPYKGEYIINSEKFGGEMVFTGKKLRAYADARCEKLQAERDALAEKVRSIADHCRDIYAIVPRLPVEADTMDSATDALHAFGLMLGIERIDIEPTYTKDAAIDAAGDQS